MRRGVGTTVQRSDGTRCVCALRRFVGARLLAVATAALGTTLLALGSGCSERATRVDSRGDSAMLPASQPASNQSVVYDPTLPKPVEARDLFERAALERWLDMQLADAMTDKRSQIPPYTRKPLPPMPPDARIAPDVQLPPDRDPFDDPPAMVRKQPTITIGISRSTYRTREPSEVLSAIEPFLDLTQREVNVRPDVRLFESPDALYFDLTEGRVQLAIASGFEYLLSQSWLADNKDNATVLLGFAYPAHTRQGQPAGEQDRPGVPGTTIELLVRDDSPIKTFDDLRGKRLALPANYPAAPGGFLQKLLSDAGAAGDQTYFSTVTLRRYAKDAVIDVLKGKADVACVDEGTAAALDRFYGTNAQLRLLAASPRLNVDVLFTTLNNVRTHRTEIELTQRQLLTLTKNAEGQEVLFLFDQKGWQYDTSAGELDALRQAFDAYVAFREQPAADLRSLLDPTAAVDRRTYDRLGDE